MDGLWVNGLRLLGESLGRDLLAELLVARFAGDFGRMQDPCYCRWAGYSVKWLINDQLIMKHLLILL